MEPSTVQQRPRAPFRRGRIRCLLLLALLVSFGPPSIAKAGDDEAEARARAHFREGQIHFDLARFEEALAAFSQAYEEMPLPAFLFNIGQCHRALGDHARAIHFFRGYLRGQPDAANRAAVEKLIAESEEALARAPNAEPDPVEAEAPSAGVAAESGDDSAAGADVAPPGAVDVAPIPEAGGDRPPIHGQWWFWTAIGVVAVGGTAAAVAASGRTDVPDRSLGVVDWR